MFTMPHKQQISICIQHQCATCPETGAGLGGIEIVGDGVVCGIQSDSITIGIHKTGNTREEGISLAITLAAAREQQVGAARECQRTAGQVCDATRICVVSRKRGIIVQREVGCRGNAAAVEGADRNNRKTG